MRILNILGNICLILGFFFALFVYFVDGRRLTLTPTATQLSNTTIRAPATGAQWRGLQILNRPIYAGDSQIGFGLVGRFIDPENGVICYWGLGSSTGDSGSGSNLSCVKP